MSNNIVDGTSSFVIRKIGGGGQLIKGIIMVFSGTFDSNGYPIDPDTNIGDTGWHICDGTNSTPELRGRFVLGASDGQAVGSTGGEENHTLNVNEMPSHGHMVRSWNIVSSGRAKVYRDSWVDSGQESYFHPDGEWGANQNNAPQHGTGDPSGTTDGTGGSRPHNNMPPYYTLSYIMKV